LAEAAPTHHTSGSLHGAKLPWPRKFSWSTIGVTPLAIRLMRARDPRGPTISFTSLRRCPLPARASSPLACLTSPQSHTAAHVVAPHGSCLAGMCYCAPKPSLSCGKALKIISLVWKEMCLSKNIFIYIVFSLVTRIYLPFDV
jgi:hypothetical protein